MTLRQRAARLLCSRFSSFATVMVATMFLPLAVPSSSAQVLSTITIPNNACCAVDVNPASNRIFTSGGASGGQQIVMVDGNTNTIVATLGTGSGARVNSVSNKLYAGGVFTSSYFVYNAT